MNKRRNSFILLDNHKKEDFKPNLKLKKSGSSKCFRQSALDKLAIEANLKEIVEKGKGIDGIKIIDAEKIGFNNINNLGDKYDEYGNVLYDENSNEIPSRKSGSLASISTTNSNINSNSNCNLKNNYSELNSNVINNTEDIIHEKLKGFLLDGNNNAQGNTSNNIVRNSYKENERILKWTEMLNNFDLYVKKKYDKLKSRTRKGIPDAMRAAAWIKLAGVSVLKKNRENLYQKLIERFNEKKEKIRLKQLKKEKEENQKIHGNKKDDLIKTLQEIKRKKSCINNINNFNTNDYDTNNSIIITNNSTDIANNNNDNHLGTNNDEANNNNFNDDNDAKNLIINYNGPNYMKQESSRLSTINLSIQNELNVCKTIKEIPLVHKCEEDVILKDLDRTFPKNIVFKESLGQGQRALYRVLVAISTYNTRTGYVQGMSFPAALFLTYTNEEESFWLLHSLISVYGLENYYLPGFPGLKKAFFIFLHLFKKFIPNLYEKFKKMDIYPTMYASNWFFTCYCTVFDFKILTRIFDCIFLEGIKIIYRIALAIFKIKESYLISLDDFCDIVQYFKTIGQDIDIDHLFKEAFSFTFSRKLLGKLDDEYEKKLLNKDIEMEKDEFFRQSWS